MWGHWGHKEDHGDIGSGRRDSVDGEALGMGRKVWGHWGHRGGCGDTGVSVAMGRLA